jgi:hypothetical protein
MNTKQLVAGPLLLPLILSAALAQVPGPLPVVDDKPAPQVDAKGPSAAVTCMAFSPDGKTLYAAGLDKVVRVWTLQNGAFVLKSAYRVPLGPGNIGAVNAVALSPDGAWVAMAGRAPMRGEAGFRHNALIVDGAALTAEHNKDVGVIYVANTGNPAGGKVLRGHSGAVKALAFAPPIKGEPALLVSAAEEHDGDKRSGGLRLWQWDAAKKDFKLLAARGTLPWPAVSPQLAIWRAGSEALKVRAAVTWPKKQPRQPPFVPDYLHLWEVDTGKLNAGKLDPGQLASYESEPFLQSMQLLSVNGKVLTGCYGPDGGQLLEWDFGAEKLRIVAEFPRRDNIDFLPRGLAVVLAKNGPPTGAAVVLETSEQGKGYVLALVDLKLKRKVGEMVPLVGSDMNQMPAVAASDRHIAVAAMRDRGIRVYAVDVVKGKTTQLQVLGGAGLALRQLAFVGKGTGLWLSAKANTPALTAGWVFDFNKGEFGVNKIAGLESDTPAKGAVYEIDKWDETRVTVRQGQKVIRVRLPDNVRVTAPPLLRPAAPALKLPDVLAVACTEIDANRPFILLCHPADGKPYRLLTGHFQDVVGLAFSKSRPLLASVGDDQTVCVWSLADIDMAVGEVPGLGVGNRQGKNGNEVVVLRVDKGSPVEKTKLSKGDVLEKLAVPGGKAQPIKDAVSFLVDVFHCKPGDEVVVTTAKLGEVKLPVQRGVDGRNPLFSLFLKETKANKVNLDWVGWSPVGPYDYSSAAAEAHLGWHRNTGDPANPVDYAPAGGDRKTFHKKNILRFLAQEADLARALKKLDEGNLPPPPPKAVLYLLPPDGAQPTEKKNEYLVRQGVKLLEIGINEDYPLDGKHVLHWRLGRSDGENVQANAKEVSGKVMHQGKKWLVALPKGVDWRRGTYEVRVSLHARQDAPALDSTTDFLRFQPPAPIMSISRDGKAIQKTEKQPLRVDVNKLTLTVDLQPWAGQTVQVQFEQFCNGLPEKKPPQEMKLAGPKKFDVVFALQPGRNELVVRAKNGGALDKHEREEEVSEHVWVIFQAKEPPPRLVFSLTDAEKEGGVWVVSRPDPILTAKVEADGILEKAAWSLDNGNPESLLAKLGPKGGEVEIQLKNLKEGQKVSLRLAANSKNSLENQVERLLVFYPPLPAITRERLGKHDELKKEVKLKGTVEKTKFKFDYRIQVKSSDGKQVKDFLPQVNLAAGTWEVLLELFPGNNTIESFVKNDWRDWRPVEGGLELRYRRPPRITKVVELATTAVDTNWVKLDMTVESPADRPLTEILVDKQPVLFDPPQPAGLNGDYQVWKVHVPKVLVNADGKELNRLEVQVVNDDGASLAETIKIVHQKTEKTVPAPRVAFVNPVAPVTTGQAKYTVTFRVESEVPLDRVEISGGASTTVLRRRSVQQVQPAGKMYLLQAEAEVELNKGLNVLKLTATNNQGTKSLPVEVPVTYKESAVLIHVDRIGMFGQQVVLAPEVDAHGVLTFPPAANSLVLLEGWVRWSNPQAEALDDPSLKVIVKVGDCLQFPVELKKRGKGDQANVREFRVPMVLIGKVNKIHIEVPSVVQQERSTRQFELVCAKPATQQRLHLLVIGVDVENADKLKNQVLDALGVGPDDRPEKFQGPFKRKPPFDECILYRVLAGDVNRNMVIAQLAQINLEIEKLAKKTEWLNDLVLIYYQGEDWQPPKGKGRDNERWLKMSQNLVFDKSPVETFALACHQLPRLPGVPLLLLNVAGNQAGGKDAENWGGDRDTGFLRYALDVKEMGKPDSALLRGLKKATSQKGRLGDVVELLEKSFGLQPLVSLDPDQKQRLISGPK